MKLDLAAQTADLIRWARNRMPTWTWKSREISLPIRASVAGRVAVKSERCGECVIVSDRLREAHSPRNITQLTAQARTLVLRSRAKAASRQYRLGMASHRSEKNHQSEDRTQTCQCVREMVNSRDGVVNPGHQSRLFGQRRSQPDSSPIE